MTVANQGIPDSADRCHLAVSSEEGAGASGQDLHSVCSVSAMARKLGLSRSRFYQLQQAGVFPPPVYCIRTRRPFYHESLQHICLEIRRSGIGNNGRLVVFYHKRKKRIRNQSPPNAGASYAWLTDFLRGRLGMQVTRRQIELGLKSAFPQGLGANPDESVVLQGLLKYFGQRRNITASGW